MKIAIAIILAGICCCAMAACPTESQTKEIMTTCMEKVSPGSSSIESFKNEIEDTIQILGKGEAGEDGEPTLQQINDTLKQASIQILMCFAEEFIKDNPEITTIVFDCVAGEPEENDDPQTRRKEIGTCVTDKITAMCPSNSSGKSKRSIMSLFFK